MAKRKTTGEGIDTDVRAELVAERRRSAGLEEALRATVQLFNAQWERAEGQERELQILRVFRDVGREERRAARSSRARGTAQARAAKAEKKTTQDAAKRDRIGLLRRTHQLSDTQIAKRLGCSRRKVAELMGRKWSS